MTAQNILITGATGFIGRSYLKYNKLHNVFSITNERRALTDINISSSETVENLSSFIKKNKIEAIIHLATKFMRNDNFELVNKLVEANYTLPMKLLAATEDTDVTKFIYVGSSWEQSQDYPKTAKNLYAAVKKSFDTIAGYWAFNSNIQISKLTLFDTFGPFDDRNKIVDLIIGSQVKPLKINDPNRLINLSYSVDVCTAIDCLLRLDQLNKTVNQYLVKSKEEISLRELVNLIENIVNRELNVGFGNSKSEETFSPAAHMPVVPGWTQTYTVKDGLIEKISLDGGCDD